MALLILPLFIFIAYRNWRHLLNLFLSLIVNLCITFLLVWLFNVNIHVYTLAGIAIAFGIMIDHAIIMVDYYRQYKNKKVFIALLG
ncbi:efflux RND transporter permease subunit, partial [Pseudomonas viridiflava]|uniref:efflux RND transporter permease subunit n=1 Tax=Pseudomonas viridiflava TaxID=33069 RepID=UPI0013CF3419